MTEIPFVVTIPLHPDRALSPNTPIHYMDRHKAKQEAKQVAYYSTVREVYSAVERGDLTIGEPAVKTMRLDVAIYWGKGRKRMDDDNAWASLKAFRDGIAEALNRNDKDFVSGTLTQDRDRDGVGYVVVTLRNAA